ncbi:MAG: T9SS type A sorting domain-containing protein [Bacteroidetes bacterium]|nr:T9SS type A sorting domain-containing protein [Bacteroidota bacterium]
MKKYYAILLTLSACFLVGINQMLAQRMVFVPSSNANVGVLNDSIFGDTTAMGQRIDSNTVYVLERGGFYLLNGSIENRFPLTIMAEDGTGARPVLQPADPGGGSSRPFRPRADLTLKGLYVTSADNGGGLNTRIVRVSGDGITISLDDCHLDNDGQSAFRLDASDVTLKITNSIISNIGRNTSPDNGRVLDDRGNPIDTLIMENNTFYNITSSIIRDDGGIINYLWYNHNTAVNIGQRGLEIGPVKEMRMTNNLFYNTGVLGAPPNDIDDLWIIKIDSLGSDSMGNPISQSVDLRNNNFVLDTANLDAAYPDTINYLPLWNDDAQSFLTAQGVESTITSELVTFDSMPSPPSDVIISVYDTSATPLDYDIGGASVLNPLTFDFHYDTGDASATGSTAGQPLGDLNWWGQDITAIDKDLVSNVKLTNFPNPFMERTTIAYEIKQPANIELRLFNSVGQAMGVLYRGKQLAGEYKVQWTPSNLPAGIYYYQLKVDEVVTTNKMVLVR